MTNEQITIFAGGIMVGMVLSPILVFGIIEAAKLLSRLWRKLFDHFHAAQRARLQAEYKRGYDAGYVAALGPTTMLRHGEEKPWSRF